MSRSYSDLIRVLMLAIVEVLSSDRSFAEAAPPKPAAPRPEPYIYLSGGVHRPGRYDWIKGMTLMDAIDEAGGFTDPAPRKVKIAHFDGTITTYDRGGTNAPPRLEAGDRISIPVRVF